MRPVWECENCGATYRFRYTPGVLVNVPTKMPSGGCPKKLGGVVTCGGRIAAANDEARQVEAIVASNAEQLGPFMNAVDEDVDEELPA